ncbi:uncharacterized protein [Prorops nasuta]|uniref:uncharacterized protein n=1 Tax=Prorops nasuta TaxID=863751 RepID=UPI0034CF1666
MGLNDDEVVVCCKGGIGSQIFHGKKRVNELQKHANLLQERLKLLESMLPDDKISGSNASKDCLEKSARKRESENLPQVCILKQIANKEKTLREQIYDMQGTEEIYKNILSESQKAEGKRNNLDETVSRSKLASKGSEVKEQIAKLEACSRKLCAMLRRPRKYRGDLSYEAEMLTKELESVRRKMGLDKEKCLEDCPQGAIDDKTERGRFKDKCAVKGERGKVPKCRVPPTTTILRDRVRCPCGQKVKCDSCTDCHCDDWEEDFKRLDVSESKESVIKGTSVTCSDISKTESSFQCNMEKSCACAGSSHLEECFSRPIGCVSLNSSIIEDESDSEDEASCHRKLCDSDDSFHFYH